MGHLWWLRKPRILWFTREKSHFEVSWWIFFFWQKKGSSNLAHARFHDTLPCYCGSCRDVHICVPPATCFSQRKKDEQCALCCLLNSRTCALWIDVSTFAIRYQNPIWFLYLCHNLTWQNLFVTTRLCILGYHQCHEHKHHQYSHFRKLAKLELHFFWLCCVLLDGPSSLIGQYAITCWASWFSHALTDIGQITADSTPIMCMQGFKLFISPSAWAYSSVLKEGEERRRPIRIKDDRRPIQPGHHCGSRARRGGVERSKEVNEERCVRIRWRRERSNKGGKREKNRVF